MIIAVDFDGTCVKHEFPKVGGKNPHAVRVLKRLVEEGHLLILWTMRANKNDNTGYSNEVKEVHNGDFLDQAAKWFEENEISLYGIQRNPTQDKWTSSPKAYAQIYIDDAALGCPLVYPVGDSKDRPYVDWIRVERLLQEMGVLNEN